VSNDESEFLLISEAVTRLEAGMFGGVFKRPKPVEAAKKIYTGASVGFGPRRERAASVILRALLEGDLPVYVITQPTEEAACRPIVVPADVLQRMPRARGGLPDHPVRHPVSFLRNYPVAHDLFTALAVSALHLRRPELSYR
jgi:hypothetical protein